MRTSVALASELSQYRVWVGTSRPGPLPTGMTSADAEASAPKRRNSRQAARTSRPRFPPLVDDKYLLQDRAQGEVTPLTATSRTMAARRGLTPHDASAHDSHITRPG